MILNLILAALAVLSVALLLWQWLAAMRFPLHARVRDQTFAPAVTLLKPLKGRDPATEDCLRSWLTQNYAGPLQVLFGVGAADDPVCEIVRGLIREFPQHDTQLVVCTQWLGANSKVSKLAELESLAKHDVLVVSDADVRVPPDFLANVVARLRPSDESKSVQTASSRTELPDREGARSGLPLLPTQEGGEGRAEEESGAQGRPSLQLSTDSSPAARESTRARQFCLVTCFYRLANPTTLAMQWEAIAINADFWSQVLQAKSLKPLDFALGAVMAIRRRQLDEIGGFKSLVDCLADDYQLGNRIARRGYRIALCPVVVDCVDPPMDWRDVWTHQLRWARTIRVCQPLPYFFSVLSNPTLWPLLWLLFKPTKMSLAFFVVALGLRLFSALDLPRRLTGSSAHRAFVWLAPIKDLLQAAIWSVAFAGNRIEWRGRKFKLRRDGTLERL